MINDIAPQENKKEINFNLYPNPASDRIYISCNDNFTGKVNLQISDVSGLTIFSEQVAASSFAVDTTSLAAGVYTVTISKDDYRAVKKLIVLPR
ncbi:MAG: T9SS type A sorting domain-containing protein [Bacteroidota bacterium]